MGVSDSIPKNRRGELGLLEEADFAGMNTVAQVREFAEMAIDDERRCLEALGITPPSMVDLKGLDRRQTITLAASHHRKLRALRPQPMKPAELAREYLARTPEEGRRFLQSPEAQPTAEALFKGAADAIGKRLTHAQFEALDHGARNAFIRTGGKISN